MSKISEFWGVWFEEEKDPRAVFFLQDTAESYRKVVFPAEASVRIDKKKFGDDVFDSLAYKEGVIFRAKIYGSSYIMHSDLIN